MSEKKTNKRKIINDPVYGFINIPSTLLFEIIEHPIFQRLRRIKQLGLTYLVYPGAFHTRFQHAIGAMHLTTLAIDVLRQKGAEITEIEAEAVCAAILLHDIGHGPFSHALEKSIIPECNHEQLSLIIMEKLNEEFDNKLQLAIQIFIGTYHKKFLHQLISSQLDMDRLDYLRRDSFFTGVSEGTIGSDRIIKMLDVVEDELVVEAKGIYSIEKFLIARRLMYWQVYLHKTVLASELMLEKVLKRARQISLQGTRLTLSENLHYFLTNSSFSDKATMLNHFILLDDYDIIMSLKQWCTHNDTVLQMISSALINRHIYKIRMEKTPYLKQETDHIKQLVQLQYKIPEHLMEFLLIEDAISNNAYSANDDKINILRNNQKIDIAVASDMLNIEMLSKTVTKHVLCYPKEIHKLI